MKNWIAWFRWPLFAALALCALWAGGLHSSAAAAQDQGPPEGGARFRAPSPEQVSVPVVQSYVPDAHVSSSITLSQGSPISVSSPSQVSSQSGTLSPSASSNSASSVQISVPDVQSYVPDSHASVSA